jgi:hypothetical protein
MDDISEKCCLVYDYGANLSLARRLAREFGRVLYFRPWKESEPKTSNLAVGDGFPDIERVRHFWQGVQAADLVCFPDLYDGDLQIELERQGKRVWGSRMAERLEYDRPHFLKTLQKVGLPCVEHTIITGVSNLEAYLHESENENQWVKVNLRGDDETWHHETWEGSRAKLRAMHHQYDAPGSESQGRPIAVNPGWV